MTKPRPGAPLVGPCWRVRCELENIRAILLDQGDTYETERALIGQRGRNKYLWDLLTDLMERNAAAHAALSRAYANNEQHFSLLKQGAAVAETPPAYQVEEGE